MASLLVPASRACCAISRRAAPVRSVLIVQRSFSTSSFNRHASRASTSLGASRKESSLATARQVLPDSAVEEQGQKKELPHFMTLKGSISPLLLKALTEKPMKLVHMSPVQAEVFPLLPQLAEPYDSTTSDSLPRDLLVKARTGTGKTLAFLLPAIEARLKAIGAHGKEAVRNAGLESDKSLEQRAQRQFVQNNLGTLIISPTRELATQIAVEAQKLTSHLDGFGVVLFVGGESRGSQLRNWMRGRRDILVTTPGRLRDFLASEPEVAHGVSKAQTFILDEADTLLDMGFRTDIDAIASILPPSPQRQTFLFSATVSKAIQQIAREMLAPTHRFINCVPVDSSPVHAHVQQYHTVLQSADQQIPHVIRLLAHDQLMNPGSSKSIVFLPTTKMTQLFASVVRDLARTILPSGRNTRIYEIHSKRTMDARSNASNAFRADKSGASILISSDVSARGIDYPGVSRVIQVGIPSTPDQYVHRVGRTGRAGTKGRGDLVLLPWELHYVTSMLSDLPLKPLKYSDLTQEVLGLGKKFDANPQEFFAQAPWAPATSTRVTGRRDMPVTGPSMFQHPVTPKLEDVESDITKLVGQFDGEVTRECFMSLLGYYVVRCGDLRLTKEALMEGLGAWSTDACGLSVPPYVSASFLQRLGLGERSMRSGMRGSQKQYGNSSREGRGRQASWDTSEGGDRLSRGGRSDGGGYGGRGGQGGRESYSQGGRGGYDQGGRSGYNQGGRNGYSQRGRGGYSQRGGGYSQGGGYNGGRGREGGYGELGRGVA